MTKKEIAHSRRQNEANRRVVLSLAAVVGLILVVVLIAAYDQLVAQPSKPVAVVNGQKVTKAEYQDRVVYQRWVLDQLLTNVQYQLQYMDNGNEENAFMVQYYQQIANQLYQQRQVVDSQAKDDMVDEILIRARAAELGLTVSEEEVNQAISDRMASRQGALTQAQATSVAATVAAVTATAETFTPVPSPTAAVAVSEVVTDTPASPTPAPTPTTQIMNDDELNKAYQEYVAQVKKATGFSEAQYRQTMRDGLLQQKVAKYYADQVPAEAEQVDLSQIQAPTEAGAQIALARLDAGDAFDLVATEVSSNTRTSKEGGEMGWYLADELGNLYGDEMREIAFTIEPGSYSQPITSTLGWQIVKVNDRGVHELDDMQLQNQQRKAYDDWLATARTGEGIQDLWTPEMAPPDATLEAAQ